MLVYFHVSSVVLSQIFFASSLGAAFLVMYGEELFRRNKSLFLKKNIPPLEVLDRFFRRSFLGGIAALALGMGSGIKLLADTEKEIFGSPRVIFLFAVLGVYIFLYIVTAVGKARGGKLGSLFALVFILSVWISLLYRYFGDDIHV